MATIMILETTLSNPNMRQPATLQVLNRSPEDLKHKITAEQLDDKEQEFFNSRTDLQRIPDESKGMPALISKLTSVQARCVQEYVPEFKQQVWGAMSVWPLLGADMIQHQP